MDRFTKISLVIAVIVVVAGGLFHWGEIKKSHAAAENCEKHYQAVLGHTANVRSNKNFGHSGDARDIANAIENLAKYEKCLSEQKR